MGAGIFSIFSKKPKTFKQIDAAAKEADIVAKQLREHEKEKKHVLSDIKHSAGISAAKVYVYKKELERIKAKMQKLKSAVKDSKEAEYISKFIDAAGYSGVSESALEKYLKKLNELEKKIDEIHSRLKKL